MKYNHHNQMPQVPSMVYEQTKITSYSLIFIIMVVIGRIQEIVPGLEHLSLGKVAFGLAIILYITTPNNNHSPFTANTQIKCLLLLLTIGIVSIPFSAWPGISFKFMLFGVFNNIVMLFLLIKLVNNFQGLKWLLWWTAVSVGLLSATAFLFYKGGRASASGTYDPNDLAFILVVFLPMTYFLFKQTSGFKKLILTAILFVNIVAVILTQSRGGFIGLVVIMLAIILFEKVSIKKLIAAAVPIVLIFSLFSPEGYWDNISSIADSDDYNRTAGGGRIEIWKRGLTMVKENPLLGVGPMAFQVAEGALHTDERGNSGKWSTAHNSFVQLGAEFGIIGFFAYLGMIYYSIKSVRVISRLSDHEELRWLAQGVEGGFYGFISCGFFLSQAYSSALFFLVAVSIILTRIWMTERSDKQVEV